VVAAQAPGESIFVATQSLFPGHTQCFGKLPKLSNMFSFKMNILPVAEIEISATLSKPIQEEEKMQYYQTVCIPNPKF
jgi:hypothetical protein